MDRHRSIRSHRQREGWGEDNPLARSRSGCSDSNRHQTYPYIGAAAPQRLQELDADILKHELGCNIVRTSHYAQSPYFLNRCDEIDLLVFEELAGWQHIGDDC